MPLLFFLSTLLGFTNGLLVSIPGFDSWLAADDRNLTWRSTFFDDYAYSLPLLEGGFHFYFLFMFDISENNFEIRLHGLKCGAITGRDIDCFRQHPVDACHDRIVVSSLCCGRSNPGSNPGHGGHSDKCFFEAYLQYCLWKRCTVVHLFRIIYFILICFTGFIVLFVAVCPYILEMMFYFFNQVAQVWRYGN